MGRCRGGACPARPFAVPVRSCARPRGAVLLAALAASCGGGGPIPGPDLALRVAAARADVEFGRPFPVTVVRTWTRDLVPAEWSDAALAPLVVRTLGTARREDGRRIDETRRLLARAFRTGEVSIPAPLFEARPRDGGPALAARGDALVLQVRPALDPAAPGPPEFPEGPLGVPPPRWPWVAAFAALAASGFLLVRRWKVPPPPVPLVPPAGGGPSPEERALALLDALRARPAGGGEDPSARFGEAAGILRGYVVERAGVRAFHRTTEEILAAPAAASALGAPRLALLGEALGRFDLVKFAGDVPDEAARAEIFDGAEDFLRTAAPPESRRIGP